MGRKKKEQDQNEASLETGGQMELMEVHPKNAAAIIRQARVYKPAQKARLRALKARLRALTDETTSKEKLLGLIKEANLQRLDDGSIRFKLDGFSVTVTPRDELVKVKEPKDDLEGEDSESEPAEDET